MAKDNYSLCKHIKREEPEHTFDEKIAKEIGLNYRTIPTFEKGLFEHQFIRHYSLQRNELLKCRWEVYRNSLEGRVFSPFQFPDIRDLHFHHCAMRFIPTESLHYRSDFRKKLKVGPGVDFKGQMPIPQELHMKRGVAQKENGDRRKNLSAKKKNMASDKKNKSNNKN